MCRHMCRRRQPTELGQPDNRRRSCLHHKSPTSWIKTNSNKTSSRLKRDDWNVVCWSIVFMIVNYITISISIEFVAFCFVQFNCRRQCSTSDHHENPVVKMPWCHTIDPQRLGDIFPFKRLGENQVVRPTPKGCIKLVVNDIGAQGNLCETPFTNWDVALEKV